MPGHARAAGHHHPTINILLQLVYSARIAHRQQAQDRAGPAGAVQQAAELQALPVRESARGTAVRALAIHMHVFHAIMVACNRMELTENSRDRGML